MAILPAKNMAAQGDSGLSLLLKPAELYQQCGCSELHSGISMWGVGLLLSATLEHFTEALDQL